MSIARYIHFTSQPPIGMTEIVQNYTFFKLEAGTALKVVKWCQKYASFFSEEEHELQCTRISAIS